MAGIPLYLPKETWVVFVKGGIRRYSKINSFPDIAAQGMVFKFQIGDKTYNSCFDGNNGDFTGYYESCNDSLSAYKLAQGDIGANLPEFKSFTNPGYVVFGTVLNQCGGIHVAEYKYDCIWSDPKKKASGSHKTRAEVMANFLGEMKIEEVTAIEPGYQPVTYPVRSIQYVARNISIIPYPCISNFTEQELNIFLESKIIFFKEINGKIYPLIPTSQGHLTYWDDNNLDRHYYVYHKTLGWCPVEIEKYNEAAVIVNTLIELGGKITLWGIRAASVIIPVVGEYQAASLLTILALETSLSVGAFAIHQNVNELYIDVFLPVGGLGVAKLFKTLDLIQTGKNAANIPTSGPFQTLNKKANDVLITSSTAEHRTFAKLKEEFPKTISESGGLTKAQKWEKFVEDLDNVHDAGHNYSIFFSEKGIKAWDKLLKQGNPASDILKKDIKTLEWFAKHGDNIPKSVADDLIASIDKPIKETIEDAQGRLTYVLDRPGQSNKVISVHTTSSGQFKATTYSPAYNPDLNPSIPVPLSANKLTPDYINTAYMHPLQGNSVVKIELSGDRAIDFARARTELGITQAQENAAVYVWHHMDDFEIINGKAYGTMQLVERSAHNGTGVLGMQHSGSAAQWRAYYGSGY